MSLAMSQEEREAFLAEMHVGVIAINDPGRGPLTALSGRKAPSVALPTEVDARWPASASAVFKSAGSSGFERSGSV